MEEDDLTLGHVLVLILALYVGYSFVMAWFG